MKGLAAMWMKRCGRGVGRGLGMLGMGLGMMAGAAAGDGGGEMAPVISDLPGSIVGDQGFFTPPSGFVYPDVFNLDTYVTDDLTTDGAIVWSYENAQGRYVINGVVALGGGDPNAPGEARLDTQDLDARAEDGNPRTITIRDTVFSPVGGPDVDPVSTGIVANGVVMLFASDGTTYSMKEMVIYTDNGGEDRLSSPCVGPPRINFLEEAETTDWISVAQDLGQPARMTNLNGEGLCIEVGLEGGVIGSWISPYQLIELSAMTVYRVRAFVNAGILPAGTTPLWGLTVDNFSTDQDLQPADPAVPVIDNKYGAEYFVLDNVGGANSANGSTEFHFFFTPLPVIDADWNSPTMGMFTVSRDSNNDARVAFRVVEADGIGYGGELDAGRVCLEAIEIVSLDINSIAVEANEYRVDELSSETHTVDLLATVGAGSVVGYVEEGVLIEPAGGNWEVALATVTPGNRDPGYPGDLAEAVDNYPVVDTDGGLYRVQMGVVAPDGAAEAEPVDAIRLGADDSTNEVLMTSNVLATVNTIGMPKADRETVYTTFYHSGYLTLDTTAGAGRIRPRADILCVDTVGPPGGNPNGVIITSMSMDRMAAP